MPTKDETELPSHTRTKDGWFACRIRCGRHPRTGKSEQHRVTIKTKDAEVFRSRHARLTELSRRLTPQIAGLDAERARAMSAQAKIILERAAEQETDAAFDLCVERGEGLAPGPLRAPGEWHTFGELAKDYYTRALYKRFKLSELDKATLDDDESKLKYLCANVEVPIYGLLGDVPLKSFTVEHAQAAYAQLPPTARRDSTKISYWQAIHRLLEIAVYPCKVIAAQPLHAEHRPTNNDTPIRYPYMHPHDDFLMCRYTGKLVVEGVDVGSLLVRALFGMLNREGCRVTELLEMLTWARIDERERTIKIGPRKNGKTDKWDTQPGTLETLFALRELMPEIARLPGPFHGLPRSEKWAARLVGLLSACGARRELVEAQAEGEAKMRAHDTRATFVTLSKAYDMPEAWILKRTGHELSSMLRTYDHTEWRGRDGSLGKLLRLDVALGRDELGLGPLTEAEIAETAGRRPAGDDDPEAETNRETEMRTIVRATVPRKWIESRFDACTEDRSRTGKPVRAADFESPLSLQGGADGPLTTRNPDPGPSTKMHSVSAEGAPSRQKSGPVDPVVEAFRAAARAALEAGDDDAAEAALAQVAARKAALAPPTPTPPAAPEPPPVASLDDARRRREGGRA